MCDERERLIGFVYDECDPEERREIARHLEECGTCRTEISDLRNVRQDLLAWDVEGGPAVWRPYVAPAVQPWYKQIPAWAMAAAATLMFLVGAAGGFVTQTLMRGTPDAAAGAIVAVPPRQPAVSITEAEQRIVDRLRAELVAQINAARPAATSTAAASNVNPDQILQRVNNMVEQSEQRMYQLLLDSNNAWAATTQEVRDAQRKMQGLHEVVLTLSNSSGGGR